MPSVSKKQQRFFGMVHKCQKTGDCASPEVKDVSKSISFKDADEFASTKHKGLPEKKKKKKKKLREIVLELGRYPTFMEWMKRQESL
jgi:hypothetical protein